MKRNGDIVSYTSEELAEMRARGESRSNFARADAMTDAEIEAAIATDPDEAEIEWSGNWMKGAPSAPKEAISLRVDPDVLAFFRKGGAGYQTRINDVLRAYVKAVNGK
jgi:uncharacterized protein (DUF4415 family)